MTRFAKRFGLLVLSLGLIVAIAAAGFLAMLHAQSKTESVLLDDRLDKTTTLAGLAQQFFQFEFKEMLKVTHDASFTLKPGDAGDRRRLAAFVDDSVLIDHGAVLLGLDGRVLNAHGPVLAFPAPTDPGLQPLLAALQRGEPGMSSVMSVGETPIVGLGLPIMSGATPRALLLAFFRAETSPLQQYNERLTYGRRGVGYIVDSSGIVVSSTKRGFVGTRLDVSRMAGALARSRSETRTVPWSGGDVVAAYAPLRIGGWSIVNVEPEADFFGPVRSGSLRTTAALLALLVVAAASVAISNAKRHRALAKAYEYKGELLANTTHELKTPLTAIRGAAMTLGLRRRDMSDEQVDLFLGMIHRRTQALQKLVDRILTGARLEAGREVPISPEPVDVSETLVRLAAEFADSSPRHQIDVSAPEGVRVHADPVALDQVLGLLMENAIKYSPDGGTVRVDATPAGEFVSFRVADNGIGVGADDIPHVFDAYFKAWRGDRQSFGGVGLGLSIAKHLVERHGGRISVVSTEGVGTVFTFTLPVAAGSADGVGSTVSTSHEEVKA